MLAPSLTKAIGTARRRACAGNQAAIIKGAGQYALSDRRKCLPTIFKKTDPNQGYDKWGNMAKGNPGCLWLLVTEKQVDRSTFLCGEAETNRSWTAPALDAKGFTYTSLSTSPLQDISTLSFSFISMTYHTGTGAWDAQLADQMSMDLVPGTLVVLADQNPRCTLGTTGALKAYDPISGNQKNKYTRKNSLNHKREGQNITRWDGSVKWSIDPNDSAGNDIYTSDDTAKESEGKRKEMNDSFVLP
jgi:hypothetical protein